MFSIIAITLISTYIIQTGADSRDTLFVQYVDCIFTTRTWWSFTLPLFFEDHSLLDPWHMFKFTKRTWPSRVLDFYLFSGKLGNKPKEETMKDHLFINSKYKSYSASYLCNSLDGTTMFFFLPSLGTIAWAGSQAICWCSSVMDGCIMKLLPQPKQLFNQVNVCAKSSFYFAKLFDSSLFFSFLSHIFNPIQFTHTPTLIFLFFGILLSPH